MFLAILSCLNHRKMKYALPILAALLFLGCAQSEGQIFGRRSGSPIQRIALNPRPVIVIVVGVGNRLVVGDNDSLPQEKKTGPIRNLLGKLRGR